MIREQHDEIFDVLIIGAGLSGIGAGRYLREHHPRKSIAILEARSESGGTWDLFRYPGIRSDSDLNTFAYEFKPWTARNSIADGSQILDYLRETASEAGLDRFIHYQHRVVSADWVSALMSWKVVVQKTDAGGRMTEVTFTAKWLFGATGYYRYDQGYSPHFPAQDAFTGDLVHPQHWPESLDYAGKRVVVIGSGATAVTLVPAMTKGVAPPVM